MQKRSQAPGKVVSRGRDHLPLDLGGTSSCVTQTAELVDHPSHYGGRDNPYEVVKVLEAWGFQYDAYLFNTIKYIARAGKKSKDPLTDLKKALWYLQRRIDGMAKP